MATEQKLIDQDFEVQTTLRLLVTLLKIRSSEPSTFSIGWPRAYMPYMSPSVRRPDAPARCGPELRPLPKEHASSRGRSQRLPLTLRRTL